MIKSKQRFADHIEQGFRQAANRLLDLTLNQMDYPNFDPARAEQLTRELLATGRIAVVTEGTKGLCV
jgi:hypothetical protein